MKLKIFLWAMIIWVLPVIYFTQKNEAKFKKNILIGTTLPEEAKNDEDVLMITDRYLRRTKMWGLILTAAVIPGLLPKGLTWVMFYWMLWLDAIIVFPQIPFVKANKQLRNLKKEKGWARNPEKEETVVINTSDIVLPKWVSPWVFIGALAINFIPLLIDRGIWMIIGINTLCQVTFYFCYRFCFRTKSDAVNEDIELTKALTQIRRSGWAGFWVKAAYATAVLSFSFLLLGNSNGWFLTVMCIYTLYICAESFKNEIRIRNIQEQLTKDCGHGDFIDDDDKWLWGMFYCNRNDTHTFINARVGVGTTVNIARPFGKAVMIFAIVCLVLMPVFPFMIDAAVVSDIEIKEIGHTVMVSCGDDEWSIITTEIESIEILDDYPENLVRTWGTATDQILKGNFKSKDISVINAAINPDQPPYLLIKTVKGKYYLFGRGSEERTMELYEMLTHKD